MSKDKTGVDWMDRFLGLDTSGGGMFKDIAQKLRGRDGEAYYRAIARTMRKIEPAFVPFEIVLSMERSFTGDYFRDVVERYSTKGTDPMLAQIPLLGDGFVYKLGVPYRLVFIRGDELSTEQFSLAEHRAERHAKTSHFLPVLPSLVLPIIKEEVLKFAKAQALVLMHDPIQDCRFVVLKDRLITSRSFQSGSPYNQAPVSETVFVFMRPVEVDPEERTVTPLYLGD